MKSTAKAGGHRKRIAGQAKGQKPPAPTAAQEDKRESDSLRHSAISIFILFHLVAITCIALPLNISPVRSVKELVAPYLRWTGLYQTWDMFGPDPEMLNSYVKSVVLTQDHHIHVWSFPRMEELGYGQRYEKERYRKFLEILPQPQNAPMWPDVARHVARMFNSKTDPPDKVMLIQFGSEIHPGEDEQHQPAPRPNVFYDDYLQPGDLK